MAQWEYKSLVYGIEGKYIYSLRFWVDGSGRVYGPRERSRLIGGLFQQVRQLEEALKELDQEGWELVSATIGLSWWVRHGVSVLRRPRLATSQSQVTESA
jgi:hypothetical protein